MTETYNYEMDFNEFASEAAINEDFSPSEDRLGDMEINVADDLLVDAL